MSQNNVNIQETFDTSEWEQTKISPLPIKDSPDSTLLPTVGDELRWSLQTAVQPLEAGAQMAAAIHGITTKDPVAVQELVHAAQQQFTNLPSLASKTSVEKIALQSQAIFESINRINSITLEQMNMSLLRMYVAEMAMVHPAILQYMRDNDSTFTYFKPVSESIGLMYVIVADVACTELANWAEVNVFRDPQANAAACRLTTFNKLFPEIGDTVEIAHAACNGYMMRAMPGNSACKFQGLQAHGFNNAVDATYWQYVQQAKPSIYSNIAKELNDQLRLLDQLAPVASNIFIENRVYKMPISQLTTFVDQLGEKIFNKERSTDVLIPYDEQIIKETLR